jgi:hypothetical protein
MPERIMYRFESRLDTGRRDSHRINQHRLSLDDGDMYGEGLPVVVRGDNGFLESDVEKTFPPVELDDAGQIVL